MGMACSAHRAKKNSYRVLVGNPERKIQLGKPRHRREDNVKWMLEKEDGVGMNWIDLTQDRDQWRARTW
jgi:hypothetical protein